MAALADIVAFDGETVPVQHTFVADHVEYSGNDLSAFWAEKVVGVPEFAQGTAVLTKKKVGSGMVRVGFRINLPVMESVNGQNLSGYTAPPKVALVDSHESVQWVHPRSVAQGRQNAKALMRNYWYNNFTASSTATPVVGLAYDSQIRLVFPS